MLKMIVIRFIIIIMNVVGISVLNECDIDGGICFGILIIIFFFL